MSEEEEGYFRETQKKEEFTIEERRQYNKKNINKRIFRSFKSNTAREEK